MATSEKLRDFLRLVAEKSAPLLSAVALAATVGVFASTLSEVSIYDSLTGKRRVENRVATLENKIEMIQSDVYSEGKPVDPMDSSRVVIIEEKQKALEVALGNNIEKAVSLAMLRRDIDEIKSDYAKRIDRLEARAEAVNQLLLWMSGVIVSILLAAFGWVAARKSS